MTSQIVVPAAAKSVITPVAQTTFQVGTYSALTDTFTKVVDLNDHVSFWLVQAALPQPAKVYARSSTIRAAGERITNWNYQNRHITLTIQLLYQTDTTALLAAVRSLLAAIENPPYRLAFAPPNATVLTYADVVAVKHNIPTDAKIILAKAISNITIDFECAPGLSGDRVTLSNLFVNPGFEAPNGPAVNVFDDPLNNADAYTVLAGAAPSAAGGTMNIANGTQLTFGSPAWGAINRWQTRLFWITGLTGYFYAHYADANNKLFAQVAGTSFQLWQVAAGTATQIGNVAVTLTNTNYYWVVFTQYPAAPGSVPYLTATLINDNAGAPTGSTVATISAPAASTAGGLTGPASISASGAQLSIGGAYPGVNQVTLFGPGTWIHTTSGTGLAAGAWEQSTANTYSGGATTSYAAARLDAAPSGTLNAAWSSYGGGSPTGVAGGGAIACAPSQTLALSAWVKTTAGLQSTCALQLTVAEYDSGGTLLRSGTVASVAGAHTSWTQLSGSYTTGVSCAYVGVQLGASDVSANSNAGQSVWFDNAQCWNETTTGQTVMPYCELRFGQSPAQLLVTGLQGDLPAPAFLALGTLLGSWPLGATLAYALGRRAQASANAQLCGPSHGFYGAGVSPQSTAALDGSSYGGYYATTTVNPGWNPRAFSFAPSDLLGVYHLFSRFSTAQAAGNLANVGTRVATQQRSLAWYGLTDQSDKLGEYDGPWSYPISASATWTAADSGQVNVPALPVGALTDLTQNYLTPRSQWEDLTSGGSVCRCNWQLLLPVDGSLLVGLANNPSNATFAVTSEWLWLYHDGLLVNRAGVNDSAAVTYSLETSALAAPAHGAGGPGTSGTGVINVNSGADPYLTLDPSVVAAATATAAGASGVNQLAGYIADNAGAVLPLHAELRYSPLYLYPR